MAQAFLVEIQTKQTSVGPMYDLVFDNGDKVGAGKFMPKGATAGKYYSYEIKMNGQYKNLAPGSLKEVAAPPASSMNVAAARPTFSSDARQELISKQAAFNTAIAFTKILQDADALPIPASVKKDKRADLIEAIVLNYASRFYYRSTGEEMNCPEIDLASGAEAASWEEDESV